MKTQRAFTKGRYHTRERYERRQPVPRCKVCAEHTNIRCSGCREPICMRHKWSQGSVKLFCWECFPHTPPADHANAPMPDRRKGDERP
jgi:hypothetical protein